MWKLGELWFWEKRSQKVRWSIFAVKFCISAWKGVEINEHSAKIFPITPSLSYAQTSFNKSAILLRIEKGVFPSWKENFFAALGFQYISRRNTKIAYLACVLEEKKKHTCSYHVRRRYRFESTAQVQMPFPINPTWKGCCLMALYTCIFWHTALQRY